MANNPFLDTSFHIAWSELNPKYIKADIQKALDVAQKEINNIASQKLEKVTFKSSFLALEKATELLENAWSKVCNLTSVDDSEQLRDAYNEMLPKVAEFQAKIPLNSELWDVLKTFESSEGYEKLNEVERRFIDETMADFRDGGADLSSDKKERLQELESELAQATQKFSENVLDATNEWELVLEKESMLAGLPDSIKEMAFQDAVSNKVGTKSKPKWRFTLQMPSYIGLMTYCDDESLRKLAQEAQQFVGLNEPFDNTELLWKIVILRHTKAQLLGRDHFADFVTERRMAKSGMEALRFIENLQDKIEDQFKKEVSDLEKYKAKKLGKAVDRLEPWDVMYWSEKQKKELYGIDDEELKPYFEINNVLSGMFALTEKLYNIQIKERSTVCGKPKSKDTVEVWHSDVKFYEVFDGKEHIGSFYADWFPRVTKRGGAWMTPLKTGGLDDKGNQEKHLGAICGNLTPPIGDKPALLTHREVETIFHEFGHLLHHLLGKVSVKSLNGINVVWDFVELPSQLMENFCWDQKSLNIFAKHYETGKSIPNALFEKMIASRNHNSAMAFMRQLSFGKMDLELHIYYSQYKGRELDQIMDEMLVGYVPEYKTHPIRPLRSMTHVFGDPVGYAGGYYSYKWAEALDADVFTKFKEDGCVSAKVGKAFRDIILSRGNSEDPSNLFYEFMEREMDLNSLLSRSGIKPKEEESFA